MFPFCRVHLVSFCGFFGQENLLEKKSGIVSVMVPLFNHYYKLQREVFFLCDTTDAAAQVANQARRLFGQVFFSPPYLCLCVRMFCAVL